MQFQLSFNPEYSADKISHEQAVMLQGSCFTEHIGQELFDAKMNVCMNPHGILFNPNSIAQSLKACMAGQLIADTSLFQLNEIWHHWDFHSRYSHTDKSLALAAMNESIIAAHHFLKKADWLIVTLGSSFQYFLNEKGIAGTSFENGYGVSNCHKAPANWFEKRMLSIVEMQTEWQETLSQLQTFNPGLKIIFTVSPVRHYRDGLTENNRSKARLFELIDTLVASYANAQYFPAFEWVNDVLRDYRFFEKDMVHPNEQATKFVWKHFVTSFFDEKNQILLSQIQELQQAIQHRPRFKETLAHEKFMLTIHNKINTLQAQYPYLHFETH